MGFHEDVFPLGVEYGTTGGPEYNTSIVELDSGAEERVQRWSASRRRYDLVKEVDTPEMIADIIDFFEARQGRTHGFLFKDWSDYTTGTDHTGTPGQDVQIGTGDGTETEFQLIKKYSRLSGSIIRNRTIIKPKSGTVLIYVNSVLKTETTDYTINYTTGIVTFNTAPTNTHPIHAGFEFYVPVRFDVDLLAIEISEYASRAIRTLPLVEDVSEVTTPEEIFYGGATDLGTISSTPILVTLLDGSAISFTCNSASKEIWLPSLDDMVPGAFHFSFTNKGTTSLDIKNRDGSSLVVACPGSNTTVYVFVGVDENLTKVWMKMS